MSFISYAVQGGGMLLLDANKALQLLSSSKRCRGIRRVFWSSICIIVSCVPLFSPGCDARLAKESNLARVRLRNPAVLEVYSVASKPDAIHTIPFRREGAPEAHEETWYREQRSLFDLDCADVSSFRAFQTMNGRAAVTFEVKDPCIRELATRYAGQEERTIAFFFKGVQVGRVGDVDLRKFPRNPWIILHSMDSASALLQDIVSSLELDTD